MIFKKMIRNQLTHLDAVGAIVAYVDLVGGVGAAAAVGKLEILGAVELVQHVAHEVEDEHTHHLALDDHNAVLGVHAHATWVLQNVGAELAQKAPVLVVHLIRHRNEIFI